MRASFDPTSRAELECRGCQKQNAKMYCLDCKSDFCEQCDTTVHRSTLFNAHRRCAAGCLLRPGDQSCKQHKQKLTSFCTTAGCLIPVCDQCCITQHADHVVAPLDEVFVEEQASLDMKFRRQGEVIQGLKALSSKVTNAQTELTDNTELLISNIREDFAAARALMDEREDEILRTLETHAETSLCELEEKLHKINTCLEQIFGVRADVDKVRQAPNIEFLNAFVDANEKIDRTTKHAAKVMELALSPSTEFETKCFTAAAEAVGSISYVVSATSKGKSVVASGGGYVGGKFGSPSPLNINVGGPSVELRAGNLSPSNTLNSAQGTNSISGKRSALDLCTMRHGLGDRVRVKGFGMATIKEFVTAAGQFFGDVKVAYDDGSVFHISPSDIVETNPH